jgi:tRNA A37 threonylcarbamoyladenosine biosynthesis protein TsaE
VSDRRHLPLLDDEPTLLVTLDRVDLVAQVTDMVSRGQPPQVLGAHGDWGAGKTSFLHQLQQG